MVLLAALEVSGFPCRLLALTMVGNTLEATAWKGVCQKKRNTFHNSSVALLQERFFLEELLYSAVV